MNRRLLSRYGLLGCALAFLACGGEESGKGTATDAGTSAGPCEPEGVWAVGYTSDGFTMPGENVSITRTDTGFDVEFLDRVPPQDQCMPDAAPTAATVTSDFDAASCTLSTSWRATYCASGEQQCQNFSLSLRFSGNSASGTAVEESGWCMQTYTSEYDASATRVTR